MVIEVPNDQKTITVAVTQESAKHSREWANRDLVKAISISPFKELF